MSPDHYDNRHDLFWINGFLEALAFGRSLDSWMGFEGWFHRCLQIQR